MHVINPKDTSVGSEIVHAHPIQLVQVESLLRIRADASPTDGLARCRSAFSSTIGTRTGRSSSSQHEIVVQIDIDVIVLVA